jgi:hypothetical protein
MEHFYSGGLVCADTLTWAADASGLNLGHSRAKAHRPMICPHTTGWIRDPMHGRRAGFPGPPDPHHLGPRRLVCWKSAQRTPCPSRLLCQRLELLVSQFMGRRELV